MKRKPHKYNLEYTIGTQIACLKSGKDKTKIKFSLKKKKKNTKIKFKINTYILFIIQILFVNTILAFAISRGIDVNILMMRYVPGTHYCEYVSNSQLLTKIP